MKRLKHGIEIEHIVVFLAVVLIASVLSSCKPENNSKEKVVREPVVAGSWYPGDKEALKQALEDYYKNARKIELACTIKALIVPHAGYIYSGQVAAQGFNQIKKDYKKVIIMATNHAGGARVTGISIPRVTHYKTPLGEVKVSDIAGELLKQDLFVSVPKAHTTHVIEAELPFLQHRLTDFEIIPLVTGLLNQQQIRKAADILAQYIDSKTLIVVSSDLSHYHPYEEAVGLDTACIKNIESLNFQETQKCEACGLYSILIVMELANRNNWKAKIIDYKNSGDTGGDKSRVVGYSSIIFYSEREAE